MFPHSLDLLRAVHDDRRHQLLAAADAHRACRQLPRTEGPMQRVRAAAARLGGLLRRNRRDGKIDRLMASWMRPDRTAATLLAASADIVDLEPGTELASDRFTYLALQGGAGAPLVIEPASRSVTLVEGARMLVLPTSEVDDVARAIPALDAVLQKYRSAWTASSAERIAVERPDHCAGVRHRPRPRPTPRRATPRRDRSSKTLVDRVVIRQPNTRKNQKEPTS